MSKLEKRIREIKGSILFATFLLAGTGLYFQNNVGTISYLREIGFSTNIIVSMFIVSAFACGYIGLKHYAWNLLYYFPFVIYTGAAWLSVSERILNPSYANAPPIADACFYTLLLGFLVLDWYQDWRNRVWSKTLLAYSLF